MFNIQQAKKKTCENALHVMPTKPKDSHDLLITHVIVELIVNHSSKLK
jgi:hypothetical protein